MWLWILLTAITITSYIRASPEQIDNDFSPEENDLYLYMNERSFETAPREIEARRRSALDKNFMRFGRSNNYLQKDDDNFDDFDEEDFSGNTRTHNKNDNFLRFAKGGDFMRFGRDLQRNRNSRGFSDKNFMRFGRSVSLKRSRRSADNNENMEEYKRGNNNRDMLRFGRGNNRDMLRFGRANNRDMLRFGRRDNFLRFGRFPYNEIQDGQFASNHSVPEKLPAPVYTTLFDLLADLAMQMRNAEKESTSRVR